MLLDHKSIRDRARKIKLALFDVDGTLLNSKGVVSGATRQAIKDLQAKGIVTGLATGRPLFLARIVLGDLVDGPAIVCAGAAVVKREGSNHHWANDALSDKGEGYSGDGYRGDGYRVDSYREVYKAIMPEGLSELTETLVRSQFAMLFTNNQGSTLVSNIVDEAARGLLTYYPKIRRDEQMVDGYSTLPLNKAMEQAAPLKLDIPFIASERRETFEQIMRGFPQFQTQFASGAAHPDLAFVSVLPAEATRPRALTELLRCLPESLGELTGENLFVIGDGESDLGLFNVAGLAVAMGNAPDVVKSRAHHVTNSVEQDGVAAFIQEFL